MNTTKVDDFGFIGWCYDPKENHDKIWGYFYRPTEVDRTKALWNRPTRDSGWNVVVFYARRGKAMQFKADVSGQALRRLQNSKRTKGYESITASKLREIWPSFDEECRAKLTWEILAGKVK